MEESKKEKDMEVAHKRQQFQMHKKGYEDIVKAIESIPKTEVEIESIDMSETNKILSELVTKMNEPICLNIILK